MAERVAAHVGFTLQMPSSPRFDLSDADKDALLAQQQDMIERLIARITELETL
ncbi:hypothetical protein U1763_20410 [Sphingomonas sp. LB2R24]